MKTDKSAPVSIPTEMELHSQFDRHPDKPDDVPEAYDVLNVEQDGPQILEWLKTDSGSANRTRVKRLFNKRSASPLFMSVIYRKLTELQMEAPYMAPFIDTVMHQLHTELLLKPDHPARILPILLVGPPGVGKTYTVKRLSKSIGMESFQISLSNGREAFTLAGSPRGYSNAIIGDVASRIADAKSINPIIILDELDKASFYPRDCPSIIGPLLQLLEPETASEFEDACLQATIDTSHINWIATANDITFIPEAILSRFHVIHASAPNAAEREAIVENVKYVLMEEMHLMPKYHIALDPRLIDHYGNHSFRVLKRLMRLAIDKHLFVSPENTDIGISKEEFDCLDTSSQRAKMGFT